MDIQTIKTLVLALMTLGYFVMSYKLITSIPSIQDAHAKKWVRIFFFIVLLQGILMLVLTLFAAFSD